MLVEVWENKLLVAVKRLLTDIASMEGNLAIPIKSLNSLVILPPGVYPTNITRVKRSICYSLEHLLH